MAKIVGTWEGGRVIETSKGPRYYIRKRIGGKLYELSTGCDKFKPAMEQWQRFQANPESYEPSGQRPGGPLTIAAHLDGYLAFCESKGNSQNWRYQKRRYLTEWSEKLPGDIRSFTRGKILAAMEGHAVPHNALASLKAFCSWLRDVKGLLTKNEDVTLDLAIPAPKPAQWSAPRAITREVFKKTLAKVEDESYADILRVLGATGMHTQECLRLAQGQGEVEGNVLTIFHKNGRKHRMVIEPETIEAVQRMQKRGGFGVSRLMACVRKACKDAKVPGWAPGGLRHSFVSWMVADGATLEQVAAYTNHDVNTLRKFYNVAAIPRPTAFVPVMPPPAEKTEEKEPPSPPWRYTFGG